jgi:HEAT repeat protein
MKTRLLCSAFAVLVLVPLCLPADGSLRIRSGAEDVASLSAAIQKERDEVDPAKLKQLAELKTREAMQALLNAYDTFATLYMKLETLRSLASFDGVAEAQEPALKKLMDVATGASELELREGAVEALGTAPKMGKHFLQLIVESPAEDRIRERAMALHVKQATDADFDWYEKMFQLVEQPKGKKKKPGKDDPPELQVHQLPKVREMALQVIGPKLEVKTLVETAEDKEKDAQDMRKDGTRRIALEELYRRKDKRAVELAKDVLKDTTEKSTNRIAAARILFAEQGSKLANQFAEDGRKAITPLDLAYAMADMLVEMKDAQTEAKLMKFLAKGSGRERLFVLRAVRGSKDDKLDKEIIKLLGDANADLESHVPSGVRIEAARVLAERKSKEALPALEAMAQTADLEDVAAAGLDAIWDIRGGDAEWIQKLLAYTTNAKAEVRNAALQQLGRCADAPAVAAMVKALDHELWSTRYAALLGLEMAIRGPQGKAPGVTSSTKALDAAQRKEAMAAIVARMQKEDGRMLHEFANALWRLSGQPYRTVATAWKGWWEKSGATFEPIALADLAKRETEENTRRLRQLTRSTFFGIRIQSHRVIFILDVSGSMNELTRAEYLGKLGEPRLTVAKRELSKCLDSLEENSLFNIISFSSGVDHWLDGIAECNAKTRDEAKAYVNKLGADGGTNLYGSLKEAFRDPDVDTIFVLSDGEPSVGDVVDSGTIREHVKAWNEHRGVVINTIAVGGTFPILEWITEDSGGTHVAFP